jgi:hypothetical protein
VQDKQTQVKMIRSGETAFEKGKWYINDEMVRTGIFVLFPISLSFFWYVFFDYFKAAPRQVRETAAFFHFRHWDDYIATSYSTTWHSTSDTTLDCMVSQLRKVLFFFV